MCARVAFYDIIVVNAKSVPFAIFEFANVFFVLQVIDGYSKTICRPLAVAFPYVCVPILANNLSKNEAAVVWVEVASKATYCWPRLCTKDERVVRPIAHKAVSKNRLQGAEPFPYSIFQVPGVDLPISVVPSTFSVRHTIFRFTVVHVVVWVVMLVPVLRLVFAHGVIPFAHIVPSIFVQNEEFSIPMKSSVIRSNVGVVCFFGAIQIHGSTTRTDVAVALVIHCELHRHVFFELAKVRRVVDIQHSISFALTLPQLAVILSPHPRIVAL